MDAPNRPANRPVLPILVAAGVLVVGIAAIALVGPGTSAKLRIPDSIGDLHRTPSEEASTPDDLVATYTSGGQVALLSVTRAQEPDPNHKIFCLVDYSVPTTNCHWASGGLYYTLVNNSSDAHATFDLAKQAQLAVEAVNR